MVEDDGTGIDSRASAAAARKGHIGLGLCKERVLAFGGVLTIETPAGGGTLVRAKLPARRRTDRPASGGDALIAEASHLHALN